MKYVLLIHQGDAPTPYTPDEWGRLSEEEQQAVYADYQAINQTPGVTPANVQLAPPDSATTVRAGARSLRCRAALPRAAGRRARDSARMTRMGCSSGGP